MVYSIGLPVGKQYEYAMALSTIMSNMNSNPEKYQDYLQSGFEILKLNYSLLSYISALGAYRENIKHISYNSDFWAEFYPIAKKLIYALEHIESLSAAVFDKLLSNIQQALHQLNENAEDKVSQSEIGIPIQQLNMISQILPHIYAFFHHTKNRDNSSHLSM